MFRQSERVFLSSLLHSLGVAHGFTTRLGGTSSGPFTSLNLHERVGDNPECVKQNFALLAQEAGFPLTSLCQVFQVHGTRIVSIQSPEKNQQEADGMITSKPLVLSIKMADCVPILLTDGQGQVAAIHAGWRGSIQNIAQSAVTAFAEMGTPAHKIYAAIGPSIGPCCFLVGKEVAEQFQTLNFDVVKQDTLDVPKYHVDLWSTNRQLLLQAGLLAKHLDVSPLCTACHPDLFYSHRRDQGQSGRHLAFITGGSKPFFTG